MLQFVPSATHGQLDQCSHDFQQNITCENLTYGMIDDYSRKKIFQSLFIGVDYTINGSLLCKGLYENLSPTESLYRK